MKLKYLSITYLLIGLLWAVPAFSAHTAARKTTAAPESKEPEAPEELDDPSMVAVDITGLPNTKVQWRKGKIERFAHLVGYGNGGHWETTKRHKLSSPHTAMSFEIDSFLIALIEESSEGFAKLFTGVASAAAGFSCINALHSIWNANKDTRRADGIIADLKKANKPNQTAYAEDRLSREKLEEYQANQEVIDKLEHYLEDEELAIKANWIVASGTFLEFIGFMFSHPVTGSDSKALKRVSTAFLGSGLSIVSYSSFKEFNHSQSILKGLNEYEKRQLTIDGTELGEVIATLRDDQGRVVPILQADVRRSQSLEEGAEVSVEQISKHVKTLFCEAQKRRLQLLKRYHGLKRASSLTLGIGTGFLAMEKLAYALFATHLFPDEVVYSIGAVTGIGVVLGATSLFYYYKYIKHPPIAGLNIHSIDKRILMREALSIQSKLRLPMPRENDFMEWYTFCHRLAPVEDFSHKTGAPEAVPMPSEYDDRRDPVYVLNRVLHKAEAQDRLSLIATKLMQEVTAIPPVQTRYEEYLVPNEDSVSVNWHKIIEEGLRDPTSTAGELLLNIFKITSQVELESLEANYLTLQDHLILEAA